MNELIIEAASENLGKLLEFINNELVKAGCPSKTQAEIDISAEEIFINIALYAYSPNTGNVLLRIKAAENSAEITFIDSGTRFDPLEKNDPNILLPAEKRGIGGLGIFIVKKSMDNLQYKYENGKNILTMKKNWQPLFAR